MRQTTTGSEYERLAREAQSLLDRCGDEEGDHLREDALMREALDAIANGDPRAQEIACLVLNTTVKLDERYGNDGWRWYA